MQCQFPPSMRSLIRSGPSQGLWFAKRAALRRGRAGESRVSISFPTNTTTAESRAPEKRAGKNLPVWHGAPRPASRDEGGEPPAGPPAQGAGACVYVPMKGPSAPPAIPHKQLLNSDPAGVGGGTGSQQR